MPLGFGSLEGEGNMGTRTPFVLCIMVKEGEEGEVVGCNVRGNLELRKTTKTEVSNKLIIRAGI
jgi:hypothetical protein